MSSNRLSLNPNKTQFIWFGTPQQFSKLDLPLLIERFPFITFHSSVRNLGVVLDSTLPSQNMLLISLYRPISISGALEQSNAPSPLMSLPQLSMPSSALA